MASSRLKSKVSFVGSRSRFWLANLALLALVGIMLGCSSVPEKRRDLGAPVALPYMRMEAGECYYIDEFLPTPDAMVTGRSGGLYLRYYTYDAAIYKVWKKERLMLAFYSRDNRCWSLFEEYPDSFSTF
jgi:hypothetical protein